MDMPAADKANKYELGELLLEIGALLMVSGANTDRIKLTIGRIASAFDCFTTVSYTHLDVYKRQL